MSRLPAVQATAHAVLTRNADLLYRHALTFTLGPHAWDVRCSVRDPQRLKPDALNRLRAQADALGVVYTDLRVLTIHPDDTVPIENAATPWDDGTLQILSWSQASDFTGQRTGTCVLRRP